MINQQLLDFIKQQLQVGSNKEKISSDLLTNGWTLQDIEEGFRAAVPPMPTTTPPVSPYAGASYSQNTNPTKTAEVQQQTFQPQVQQSPIQQTQVSSIAVHPFIKHGLIIGILGIVFFIASFLFSNIEKASITTLAYLVAFEIAISLISIFCIMLVAKMLKSNDRTFVKALSAVGVIGFLSGLIYLITLLELPSFVPSMLGFAGLIFTFFFLKKIYSISYLRAFSLWLLYGLFTSIIALIIFFAVGFSFLFSIFNALQNQNPINDINTIQQVYPTQDQTQQAEQNTESQTINTNNSSTYTSPTYGYSLKYPIEWKLNDTYPNSIRITIGDSFPPENLEISVTVGIYNEATTESSLKRKNTPYQKETMTIAGIPSIKLTYNNDLELGSNTAYGRDISLFIPNKGKDGGEIVITGDCSTWATANNDKKCSTAIDDIMNNLVFPSISFKK